MCDCPHRGTPVCLHHIFCHVLMDRLMGTIATTAPFPPPRASRPTNPAGSPREPMARQAANTIASLDTVSPWSRRSRRGRQERDHAPKWVATRHRGHANHGKLPRPQPGRMALATIPPVTRTRTPQERKCLTDRHAPRWRSQSTHRDHGYGSTTSRERRQGVRRDDLDRGGRWPLYPKVGPPTDRPDPDATVTAEAIG